ncbi:Hypothetical predicted protein, partial [Paramuricea clavata]
MASKHKKPWVEKKYSPVKEWVGNRDTEGMEEWQSGIWVDKCAFFNYSHYCNQAEKIDEQKIKMDRKEKAICPGCGEKHSKVNNHCTVV